MTLAPEHAGLNEHLNAYLDGALDEPVRRRLAAHLSTCDVCRQELVELGTTRDAVRALPPLRAPRAFTLPLPLTPGRDVAGLRSGGNDPYQGAARWMAPLTWAWRLGTLGAAMCFLIALITSITVPMAPVPSSGAARSSSQVDSQVAQGQEGAPAPPAALAARDASQRIAPAAGVAPPYPSQSAPPGPAPASAPAPAEGAQAARPAAPQTRTIPGGEWSAARWLALAAALGLLSATLFAVQRRAGRGARVR